MKYVTTVIIACVEKQTFYDEANDELRTQKEGKIS